jgi:flagellin
MPQVINTNIFSINAQRNLNNSQSSMQTSLERLSSGLRINRAKDDAAGLAISDRMTAQIRGLQQSIRNVNDGVGYVQTADGALAEVTNSLQRMRELAVQASTGTISSSDRVNLNAEYAALKTSITNILANTEFNGSTLFTGTGVTVHVQSGAKAGQTIDIAVNTVPLTSTDDPADDVITGADGSTAQAQLAKIDADIATVANARALAGGKQAELESTARNLANVVENVSAARSQILDADFAKETAALTRAQILQQAGTAMLAQANTLPQNVLQLLG